MGNAHTEHSRSLRAKTARQWEAQRKAEGYVRLTVLLSPEAAAALERLARQDSKTAVIERLLIDAGQAAPP